MSNQNGFTVPYGYEYLSFRKKPIVKENPDNFSCSNTTSIKVITFYVNNFYVIKRITITHVFIRLIQL